MEKTLSAFGRMLKDDKRFKASALDIPRRYREKGVVPATKRLRPYNIASAYKAMGVKMDNPRMYRMVRHRKHGPQYDVRTRDAAITLSNVLLTVYNIGPIDWADLMS